MTRPGLHSFLLIKFIIMKKAILAIIIILAGLFCAAQNDTITDIAVIPGTDGSGHVDVYFTLNGPDSSYNIRMEVSFDAGTTYDSIQPYFLSGDVGGISPGENKHVVWDGLESFPDTYSTQAMIKLIAVIGSACPDTVTDIEGNIYTTVVIGLQCWMAENLETTQYRNGTPIEYPGSDNTEWENNTTGAYAWFDNDISWKDSYGALYNWHAVMSAHGLCPAGWHVPTDAEWTTLSNYLGGEFVAGGRLKSTRTEPDPHPRWNSPNIGATNQSDWSGLPGGYREFQGDYTDQGGTGLWWTSTEIGGNLAWSRFIINSSPGITQMNDFFKNYGASVRCIWEESQQSTLPAVFTSAVSEITDTSAISGGNVTDDGGESVTARGVVWATFENPTLDANDGYTSDGIGTGAFVSYLSGLTPGMPYFVRAYATNIVGTAYGNQEQFSTSTSFCEDATLTDYDGNVYNAVLIGSQCWMASNLETTHYRNGEPIDYPGINYWDWQVNTTGAYAWYNDNISWKESYGALYNWYAVMNSNGLCPAGWHVPSDAEWTTLSDYLGGENVAGGKLKSTRTDPDPHPRWNSPNVGATNETNWSGYPGGYRDYYGMYLSFGERGFWWTSTEGVDYVWSRIMFYDDPSLSSNSEFWEFYGLSVRCVLDE
jgi:uncharacterized protein (TIGR02145 family)